MREAGAVYLPERLHAIRIVAKKLRYALEVSAELRAWWVTMVRAGMGAQRKEQPPRIEIMPNGDAAGARGAALQALRGVR